MSHLVHKQVLSYVVMFLGVLQMFFHGTDYESLHAHIEPKYLPKVYGGIRPDFGYRDWFESVSQNPAIVKGKTNRIL